MFEATLQVDSSIISGIAKLAWQTIPTFAIYKLAELIISAHNLHLIYDRRTSLVPRNSLLFTLTNAPVGHPPLVTLLALVLLFHILLSVALDFSINGETDRIYEAATYRTVLWADTASPRPLDIDFRAEFRSADNPAGGAGAGDFRDGLEYGKRLVSRRLHALSKQEHCLFLNGTHHTAFAHAFRQARLPKTGPNALVGLDALPPLAQCVRKAVFEQPRYFANYRRTGFPPFNCDIESMDARFAQGTLIGTARHRTNAACNIAIDAAATRCYRFGTTQCAGLATHRERPDTHYFFHMADASVPSRVGFHELRTARMPRAADRARFAANVAFAVAVGLANSFNAQFFAVAHVDYDVALGTLVRERNVTVINLAILVAVVAVEGAVLAALCAAALYAWRNWVVAKGRSGYITFSSLLDVFAMVTRNGFIKRHEEGRMTRIVALVGDGPGVFEDEMHLDGIGGPTKRISDVDDMEQELK